MNSFELNKIMGAVLGTLLFVMGVGFIAEAIYHPIEGRGPGYPLPEPEIVESAEAGPAEPAVPLPVLLASASAEAGAAAVRRCQSCHTFGAGEGNRAGPELHNVVGRLIGGHEGYAYSAALAQYAEAGENWTYENLDHFLENPQHFAPGSRMNLAVRSPTERADILAYLQTQTDSPPPFPEPEDIPAEGEPVPAGEAVDTPIEGVEPEAVIETPTVTQSDTPVQGTPTAGGAPEADEGATEGDDAEAAEPEAPQPETPEDEAPEADAPADAEAAPAQ